MLNIKAFNILNPGQMPVGTSDCQIYALTKEAIYCFPDKFPGYCAMFGGLDIEQCLCSLYHKPSRSCQIRQFIFRAIWMVMQKSKVQHHVFLLENGDWFGGSNLYLCLIREGDCSLYAQLLTSHIKWFFTFDHHN